MPRIPYADVTAVDDRELREILEEARERGAPRPESQAVRAHVPDILRTFRATWNASFYEGELDHAIKELARLYVSRTVECSYCGGQRSEAARALGVDEGDVDDLLAYEDSDRFDERERAALAYADAITWDQTRADDALWERLRRHFTDRELVELGYFIALTSGQQRWIKTLDLQHGEVLAGTDAGLAPNVVRAGEPGT